MSGPNTRQWDLICHHADLFSQGENITTPPLHQHFLQLPAKKTGGLDFFFCSLWGCVEDTEPVILHPFSPLTGGLRTLGNLKGPQFHFLPLFGPLQSEVSRPAVD